MIPQSLLKRCQPLITQLNEIKSVEDAAKNSLQFFGGLSILAGTREGGKKPPMRVKNALRNKLRQLGNSRTEGFSIR